MSQELDDARAQIVAELRWLADAREEYSTDVFPVIREQAQTARHLADILERKTPVADGGEGFGWLPSWRWEEWDEMATPSEPVWEYAVARKSATPSMDGNDSYVLITATTFPTLEMAERAKSHIPELRDNPTLILRARARGEWEQV